MRLENVLFRVLWLHLVQVTSKLLIMLGELLLGDNLVEIIVFGLIWGSLSTEHESHLLFDEIIFASIHHIVDKIHIVHLLGDS
jgi:hypothetical protein